jgi:hypothetical protein
MARVVDSARTSFSTAQRAELTCAIANPGKATGARRSLRVYGAYYKTVLRLAQPQVM